ncbi:MAG: bifunctional oligoribonuclease/PAP phosphatase NrnA [Flavobacteriales bacterium]|nr:bifunctional oligoribonuclease/PAP phosphatase NrnA [Flavobacteriales bacterium]
MKAIQQAISSSGKIVITTHKGPDGDAIGSSLAMYHYLKAKGKAVCVIVPDAFPDFLKWMEGADQIIHFDTQKESALAELLNADLIFSLDYNGLSRIGELGVYVGEKDAVKVVIDHHQDPQDFADHYYVDTDSCSTSQLVYELIESFDDLKGITKNMAECLYCGIMTDTGSFRFPSTTAKTHRIIAHFLELGVQASNIHQSVYDTYSEDRLRLLGFALTEKMHVYHDQGIAYISLSGEELKRFNFKKGDTEGLVNYPLSINGIKMAVLLTERDEEVRLSFRSKDDVYVNRLANEHFNGGGHIYAAGGSLFMMLPEAVAYLKKILELPS